MLRHIRSWLRRLWSGSPCERCGEPGAKLVVDAVPAGKRVDGATGLVTRTYNVRSCEWLCGRCRRGTP